MMVLKEYRCKFYWFDRIGAYYYGDKNPIKHGGSILQRMKGESAVDFHDRVFRYKEELKVDNHTHRKGVFIYEENHEYEYL